MDTCEKAKSLFTFIKEMGAARKTIVLKVKEQPWIKYVSELPIDNEFVQLFYRDVTQDIDNTDELSDESGSDVLLKVKKPNMQACPNPSNKLQEWLEPGWENFKSEAKYKEKKIVLGDSELNQAEDDEGDLNKYKYFYDDKELVQAFNIWKTKRDIWQLEQKRLEAIRDLFNELYKVLMSLEQNAATEEVVVGVGQLYDATNKLVDHPILLKRVKLSFDAENNEISVFDTDKAPELYNVVFQKIDYLNHTKLQDFQDELNQNEYHPLDRNDTKDFLKRLLYSLSSESAFIDENKKIPEGTKDTLFLSMNPVFFKRKKLDGLTKFVDGILGDIDSGNDIPPSIGGVVGGHQTVRETSSHEPTREEELAAVGGEDPEVLLAKPANKEQLLIAKEIEKFDAVLVQGPPGTGKTHTIANLIGHFMAQGKKVLVTSHTKKALSVLKEKLPENIQSLSVSLIDDDNKDMEKSITGITEYISSNSKVAIEAELRKAESSRIEIMQKLMDIREKIYQIKFSETEDIIFNGDSISPQNAAKFVCDNTELYGAIIPGEIELKAPFPLSYSELVELYDSNTTILPEEERALEKELPDIENLPTADRLREVFELKELSETSIKEDFKSLGYKYTVDNNQLICRSAVRGNIEIFSIETPIILEVENKISEMKQLDGWQKQIIVDLHKGEAYRNNWEVLISKIAETVAASNEFINIGFGKTIIIPSLAKTNPKEFKILLNKIKKCYEVDGKITFLKKILNREYERVRTACLIDGVVVDSVEDCNLVLKYVELGELRAECRRFWDGLMKNSPVPSFEALDATEPEHAAKSFVPEIQLALQWDQNELTQIKDALQTIRITLEDFVSDNRIIDYHEYFAKLFQFLENDVLLLINVIKHYNDYLEHSASVQEFNKRLDNLQSGSSDIGKELFKYWNKRNFDRYANIYDKIASIYQKNSIAANRRVLLLKVKKVAPEWAKAIKSRNGIHGSGQVPENIREAWTWKQYSMIIKALNQTSFIQLQRDNVKLSKEYREITGKVVELRSWLNLMCHVEQEPDLQQNLIGWKETVKKIGKGKGKRVPIYRDRAKKLMISCQKAVPTWIMTIDDVLNSMVPGKNKFDIVIVDEASQSDITALTMLYLGKKVIIVGDDKQVSPSAVGESSDETTRLINMYLKDQIPNEHLFDGKTSLYDIGQTICRPLMLKEHFRCVPDIIEFSNIYCYDNKVKPLRESGSTDLLPSIVDFPVQGYRHTTKKINEVEAYHTVSLIKVLVEDKRYKDKTIGVISLLGNEQSTYVMNLLLEHDVPMAKHQIIFGDASQFQGDERDVIILNMVDSNNSDKQLMLNEKPQTWQRYNVAVTRAKDQLIVIHSILPGKDLKKLDVRSRLLEYVRDPRAIQSNMEQIEKKADSPFEVEVAQSLCSKGYHIVQQWEVGRYRIDMVACCGNKKVAIECDGEAYHSGAEKIQSDMERQIILERQGWTFIRIRGSEYYRDPKATMIRVVDELKRHGIYPEESSKINVRSEENIAFDLINATTRMYEEICPPVTLRSDQIETGLF